MSTRLESATADPWILRIGLTVLAAAFVLLFLVLPLLIVFQEALAKGLGAALTAIGEPDALAAMRLSLTAGRSL